MRRFGVKQHYRALTVKGGVVENLIPQIAGLALDRSVGREEGREADIVMGRRPTFGLVLDGGVVSEPVQSTDGVGHYGLHDVIAVHGHRRSGEHTGNGNYHHQLDQRKTACSTGR